MGSESDEVLIEDSDDSLLDLKEINDVEFDIPIVAPPSLESVLWDMESEEGSDSASIHSLQSLTAKFRSMLYHCILQGVSSQITSAGERVGAGLPTVITNSLKYVAIGTSHGYVLAFDSDQKLCWCCHDTNVIDQGAISALAFNMDSTRLLIGYERGYVSMADANNGDIIRRLPDAHAPQSAVLHLRFTYFNKLALCGDSSGCVFSLSFNRRLGIRTWDSKCLFSGARGEVCVFEPFVQGHETQFLSHHILVALATMSKVIVISIKPRLRVLFSQQLPRITTSLPLIAWQLVTVGKSLQPVLAWGRGTELNYTRVIMHGQNANRIRLCPLRNVRLSYTLTALHWIGSRHLALLDTSENLRLIEVRTQKELELLELSNAGLVYGSAHFKALAVGGGVSEAFAIAGERACYNSLSSRGDQLLVLGTKAVHMVKLRTWPERLLYLSEQGRWTEALNLAADEGVNRDKFTEILLGKYLENFNQNCVDKDSLTAAVNCCVKLGKIDLLCGELWELVCTDQNKQDWFYTLLINHICNGYLQRLTPVVAQDFINYLKTKNLQVLQDVLLLLDLSCLDLHQVLKICKSKKLYDAWIHITTKTIGDYTGPLIEFLDELTPDNHRLGNTMLVYVSNCLAGLGYPKGNIPEKDIPRVKHDILRCLETIHSINFKDDEQSYPYLRALLKYNTRECLNVIELAFTEVEFAGEMGQLQRQRLISILLQIVAHPDFNDSQIVSLACFVCRMVTNNNLKIDATMLDTVIKSLTNTILKQLSLRDHLEREQAWLDLLRANKLNHMSPKQLLSMALESKCYRVAEYVYESERNYSDMLTCYLKDRLRCREVFNYMLTHINNSERYIQQQLISNFKELLKIDSKKVGEIVTEHYPDLTHQLNSLVEGDEDLQYAFLSEIVYNDVKLPPEICEQYLNILCTKNREAVKNFVQLCMCRVEQALEITKRHGVHSATAILLEQGGEWGEALELLLNHNMIDAAVNVCIRGAEHLDSNGAQQLWLKLLQHKTNTENKYLRQILHAAAPYVPPAQLLDLVSNASLGDIKTLLQGILADCTYDIHTLTTTSKLLGRDLHLGLAKELCSYGKGVLICDTVCKLCHKLLIINHNKDTENNIIIWRCGHCFHDTCVSLGEGPTPCPYCKIIALPSKQNREMTPSRRTEVSDSTIRLRPDVEGHF